jgi:ubiquinone/menaquinone biosynthesis C-methylase UbiE
MKGAIEGKRARDYEKKLKKTKHLKIFNSLILKNIKAGKSVKVCDFCCGPGNNIELLRNKVGEIYGIDASKDMIKICTKKFQNNRTVRLKLASITDTKLKSGYFDYIIIRLGLHHVKDKQKVMDEAYRMLKPKGKFIIIDKYYLSLFELYTKGFYKLIFQKNPAIFEEYMVSKEANEKLFSTVKFKIIKNIIFPYEREHVGKSFFYLLQKQ